MDFRLPAPRLGANNPADVDRANVLQQILEYEWDKLHNTPEKLKHREALYRAIFESGSQWTPPPNP